MTINMRMINQWSLPFTAEVCVCGAETITINGGIYTNLIAKSPGNFFLLDIPTVTEWFTINNGGAQTDTSCTFNSFGLFIDSTGSVAWTDTDIEFDSAVPAVNLIKQIKVNLNTGFSAKTVYMVAQTRGLVYAYKQLTIEVCGTETVGLIDDVNIPYYFFMKDSGNN